LCTTAPRVLTYLCLRLELLSHTRLPSDKPRAHPPASKGTQVYRAWRCPRRKKVVTTRPSVSCRLNHSRICHFTFLPRRVCGGGGSRLEQQVFQQAAVATANVQNGTAAMLMQQPHHAPMPLQQHTTACQCLCSIRCAWLNQNVANTKQTSPGVFPWGRPNRENCKLAEKQKTRWGRPFQSASSG